MKEEEQISVTLPNIGFQFVPVSAIKKWDISETETIGDTIFCRFDGGSYVSMSVEDYNRTFKA